MKYFPLILILIATSGCVRHKQLVNFNQTALPTGAVTTISNAQPLRIKSRDLLKVDVFSIDLQAAAPFNPDAGNGAGMMNMNQMVMGNGSNNLELMTGYFVDEDGYIDLPVVGRTEVAGMTLEETRSTIAEKIKPYLTDVSVSIRLLNYKVTILGEVFIPGAHRISNPRLTLLEAIGLAGDMTPYANRNRILVIREKGDDREFAYLDLQKDEIFTSPFYYLQQNDVIYIEPQRTKVATVQDPFFRFISLTSVGISLLTLILTLTN